jgi:hypothetical protein
MPSIVFTAYGVTGEVVVDDDSLVTKAQNVLPPGWRPGEPDAVEARVELRGNQVLVDGELFRWTRADAAIDVIEAAVRSRVAVLAPEHVFVHAGVVAHGGGALVLPGPSLAGKTTLVSALVADGAAYLSDEFAVLDTEGAVHPYPKPLSLRVNPDSLAQWNAPVERFGGVTADRAFRAAVIAVTRYERGAQWRPVRRSPADGAMALLSNAVPARERPAETLAAVRRASADAIVLEGSRGDALETSRILLETLGATLSDS